MSQEQCACGNPVAPGKDGRCLPCRGRHGASFRRKYVWTPAMDEELRRAYGMKGPIREASKAITVLCARYRIPRHVAKCRATRMGLKLYTLDAWTKEEMDYVAEYAGTKSLNEMAKHLGRSTAAISHRIYRMGYSRAITDGYSVAELKELFGTTPRTLDKWIGRGWLKVNDLGRIPHAVVADFVWKHMEEYRFASCEEWWLKTMLKDHARGLRLTTKTEQRRAA